MGKKIKIIHFVDKLGIRGASTHGISRLFSWWMPRFDRTRFEVRLIGLRKNGGLKPLLNQGIEVSTLGKGKFDFSTLGAFKEAVEAFGADIIHLHGYGASNFGRILAWRAGVKTIVHEHFVDPAMPIYQIPFDYVLARRTDAAIAVCGSVRDFMVQKRFIPEERVQVIFNGVPLEEYVLLPEERCGETRARWGISQDLKIVSTIGRLDEQKGVKFFLEAAAFLARDYPGVTFMVVGDGPQRDELQRQAFDLGLTERAVFTGYCTDIPSLQSIIDIQVFPSLWEGLPLTLFEAMAMRRPIVATDIHGMSEVLENGRNALIVPPSDAKGLAGAIRQLLDDPNQAEKLAGQAQTDSNKYSIQLTVDKMQELYEGLIGNGGTVR